MGVILLGCNACNELIELMALNWVWHPVTKPQYNTPYVC